ncbi:hypothetical protein WDU94_014942 [Cyamophila willieti]
MNYLLRGLSSLPKSFLLKGTESPVTSSFKSLLVRFGHHEPVPCYPQNTGWINRAFIGNREVVGHGKNGIAGYSDNVFYPFPAIRYKVFECDLLLLREKEKGHWNSLTLDEKRALYRGSFRQTFAEFTKTNAYPDTELLGGIGLGLMVVAAALFYYSFIKIFVLPPLPTSLTPEGWEKTIRKQIDLKWNPITGIASYWDYEKDGWKPGAEPWILDYLPKNSPLRKLTPKEN